MEVCSIVWHAQPVVRPAIVGGMGSVRIGIGFRGPLAVLVQSLKSSNLSSSSFQLDSALVLIHPLLFKGATPNII